MTWGSPVFRCFANLVTFGYCSCDLGMLVLGHRQNAIGLCGDPDGGEARLGVHDGRHERRGAIEPEGP